MVGSSLVRLLLSEENLVFWVTKL